MPASNAPSSKQTGTVPCGGSAGSQDQYVAPYLDSPLRGVLQGQGLTRDPWQRELTGLSRPHPLSPFTLTAQGKQEPQPVPLTEKEVEAMSGCPNLTGDMAMAPPAAPGRP